MFVSLPTGFGKSVIYGLLPVVLGYLLQKPKQCSVASHSVISPLSSLVMDQKAHFLPRPNVRPKCQYLKQVLVLLVVCGENAEMSLELGDCSFDFNLELSAVDHTLEFIEGHDTWFKVIKDDNFLSCISIPPLGKALVVDSPSMMGPQLVCNGFSQQAFSNSSRAVEDQALGLPCPFLPVMGSKLDSMYCIGKLPVFSHSANNFLRACGSSDKSHQVSISIFIP